MSSASAYYKRDRVITLHQGNAATGSNNVFTLPLSVPLSITNAEIGLHTASIYNSIPNIHSIYNNTTISYKNIAGVVRTIDLQQGRTTGAMVEYSDINGILQAGMFAHGDYLYNTVTGTNVFYLGVTASPIYNAVILSALPVPINAELSSLNLTNPASMTLPISQDTTMQFTIPATGSGAGLSSTLGFTAGLYPPTALNTSYFISSNIIPNIAPVTGLSLQCNICGTSEFTNINNYLSDLPINAASNGTISYEPANITYIQCLNGSFNNITVTICDQLGNPLSTLMEGNGTRFKMIIHFMKAGENQGY
jgi:hypothetical protein